MPINRLPILSADHEPFAIHQGQLRSRGNFFADVQALAKKLPNSPYIFNLCENRYLFCVCLLAASARGLTCLLPPSGQTAIIAEILSDYPGAIVACDKMNTYDFETLEIKSPMAETQASPLAFDWNKPAVIAFTSGSTGKPKPCLHSLKTFAISANMAVRSLGLSDQRLLMVSTTPPQHMYGLETSVFWPLFSQLVLYDGQPFFPEDVRQTIATAPYPAMLLTTPTHLRTLVKIEGDWHNLAGVISATDTLSQQVAGETAAILGQSPREIYGSTETLSFACRETLSEASWRPYPGAEIVRKAGQTLLKSPHLPATVPLQDRISIKPDGRFEILGRNTDMIKIGGKRASLSELNIRLNCIDGVEDGFCFLQTRGKHAGRLAAVVVSGLDKQSIRAQLHAYVDEVFLPRAIHFVDRIPRNATGKLSKAERDKLLAKFSKDV